MEFDESRQPVTPNPWAQPNLPVYPSSSTPTPPALPALGETSQPQPITPAPAPIPQAPPAQPSPTEPLLKTIPVFPIGNIALMMFVITLVSMVLAFANDWFDASHGREISVNGTGTAYSAPDVAKIDFGVRSESRNLSSSQKANATAIAKIKNDLAAFDIANEDIQTVNYNINPDYIYSGAQKPRLTGYTTYHFLRLTIRKLDMVDAILQTLGYSGATDISQISFTIDDTAEIQSEAREKAIANAKDLAQQLANLSDAKLGQVISIKEDSSNPNNPYPMADGMGGGGGPGIEQGSLSVTSNVTLTYSLK